MKRLLRRINHDHSWEFNLHIDERQWKRELVARELHNTLLQKFLGINLQFQPAFGHAWANPPGKPLDRGMVPMQLVFNEARCFPPGVRSFSMASAGLEHSFS